MRNAQKDLTGIRNKYGVDVCKQLEKDVDDELRVHYDMELLLEDKQHKTDDEAKDIVDCLSCKNCLPPFQRVGGNMCKLKKMQF